MGRHAVNSNQVFYDGLEIPVEHRIAEEGQGFRYILDSLNPERILNAAEVLGMGRRALDKASGAVIATLTLPDFMLGAPMTYMAGGEQYLVFSTGYRKLPQRLVAMKVMP